MCKCFEEVKEKVVDHIRKSLSEHTEFEAEWKGKTFFFGDNVPKIPVGIPIEYSYRRVKVSGEPYRNKERNEQLMTMNFCPFCGETTKS